jgi:N-acetylglucosamine-6-phosphate deacetylase
MNTFNRVFNADECASTESKANYFNTHPYLSSMHAHVKPIESNITKEITIKLTNCRLVRDNEILNDDLWIRNGVILDPLKVFFEEKKSADMEIDCENLIIAPGFIDVQLNGAFGRDFTNDKENIEECLNQVSTNLLQFGVTGFCPTIVSSKPEVYAQQLPKIKRATNKTCGQRAQIFGVHLEGPFISREKIGAHDQDALRILGENGIKSLEECYGMSIDTLKKVVSIITLAPELDPTGQVCKTLTENGIIVSIGHSVANLKQGEVAIRNGAHFITHLFNAMLPFHHRDPHLIGLLSNRSMVEHEKIYYGIIADNIHTHPSAINIAYKAHPQGIELSEFAC